MVHDEPHVNRRGFFRTSAALSVLAFFAPARKLHAHGAEALVIGVVPGLGVQSSEARGITLGIREAQHAGALFNRKLEYRNLAGPSAIEGAQVVIFAGVETELTSYAEAAAKLHVVLLNATVAGDGHRRERCSPFLFHVAASEAMRRDAQAHAKGGDAVIETWHPSLERFGAGQLNDRFRETGSAMDSGAWTGWMAVKIAWESFLRTPDGSAARIASYLAKDTTHFDGHKGVPLSFRTWDHQLRQPLYVVRPGEVVEVPAPSRPDVPMRDNLDTLGDRKGVQVCG